MWRTIAAFLVVAIHCPFPGVFGCVIANKGRIAVPFFCYNNDVNLNRIISFIIFNKTIYGPHLWYMYALIYTLIIMIILCKLKHKIISFYMSIGLLLIDLIFGTYSIVIFAEKFPTEYTRNFLFCGLGYFIIGRLIRQACDSESEKLDKIGGNKMLVFFVSGLIISLIEEFILKTNEFQSERLHFFGTSVASVSLVIFLVTTKDIKNNFVSKIGKNYSKDIYLWHPLLYVVLTILISSFSTIKKIYELLLPIIIFISTLFFLFGMKKAMITLKRKYNSKKEMIKCQEHQIR